MPWLTEIGKPRVARRLPVVLTHEEVQIILSFIEGDEHRVIAPLLYGTGMPINEVRSLRTKGIEFDHSAVIVRAGKADEDRVVHAINHDRNKTQWSNGSTGRYDVSGSRNTTGTVWMRFAHMPDNGCGTTITIAHSQPWAG